MGKAHTHTVRGAAIALALAAAATAGAEIKIGVAGPLSGDLAPYGVPVRQAVELAAEHINAGGGIAGEDVTVVAEDDLCDPNTASNVANKLAAEGVAAVVGHVCSGATKAALPIYRNAGIVVVSPSSTNPDLTLGGENPNFFRTIAHDLAQADRLSGFAVDKLGISAAAVVHDKQDYGKALADAVRSNLEGAGVEIKVFEGITAGAPDYSALISKIKGAGIDDQGTAVFYCGYHPEASKIVTAARKDGIRAHFVSGDGVKDPSFLSAAGLYALDYYLSAPADTSALPAAAAVIDAYTGKFGEDVGVFSLQGYAAVQALKAGIERAGGSGMAELADALRAVDVSSAIGAISFDERGDVIGSGFAMFQVRPDFVSAD